MFVNCCHLPTQTQDIGIQTEGPQWQGGYKWTQLHGFSLNKAIAAIAASECPTCCQHRPTLSPWDLFSRRPTSHLEANQWHFNPSVSEKHVNHSHRKRHSCSGSAFLPSESHFASLSRVSQSSWSPQHSICPRFPLTVKEIREWALTLGFPRYTTLHHPESASLRELWKGLLKAELRFQLRWGTFLQNTLHILLGEL